MDTTIKVQEETKKRLLSLDLSEKGKTFDMIVNELITSYQKTSKEYKEDYKKWKEDMKEYETKKKEHAKLVDNYNKEKAMWDRLLKWAKSQGFKG